MPSPRYNRKNLMPSLADTLDAWLRETITTAVRDAMSAAPPSMVQSETHHHLCSLQEKVGKIMASLADIQTAMSREQSVEDKLLVLAQAQQASIVSLTAQLSAAVSSGANSDPNVIAGIVNQMTTHAAQVEAALAQLSGQPVAEPAVPPGQPTIT